MMMSAIRVSIVTLLLLLYTHHGESTQVRGKIGNAATWNTYTTLKAACEEGNDQMELLARDQTDNAGKTGLHYGNDDFPCHVTGRSRVTIKPVGPTTTDRTAEIKKISFYTTVKEPYFTFSNTGTTLEITDVDFAIPLVSTVYYSAHFFGCIWYGARVTPVIINYQPIHPVWAPTEEERTHLSASSGNNSEYWFGKESKTPAEEETQLSTWTARYNVIFFKCTFDRNHAYSKASEDRSEGKAGAIYVDTETISLLVAHTTFKQNDNYNLPGGAISFVATQRSQLHIYKTWFFHNLGRSFGGGIYALLGDTTNEVNVFMSHTVFQQNKSGISGPAYTVGPKSGRSRAKTLLEHVDFTDNYCAGERTHASWTDESKTPVFFSLKVSNSFTEQVPSIFPVKCDNDNNATFVKLRCGFDGIAESVCLKRGCCYSKGSQNPVKKAFCYLPAVSNWDIPASNRLDY